MKNRNRMKILGILAAVIIVCTGGVIVFAGGGKVIKVFTGEHGQKMELVRPDGYVEPENTTEIQLEPSDDPTATVNVENPQIGDIVTNENGQKERVIGIDGEGGFITEKVEE